MDAVACFPSHIQLFESIFCSIMEAFALEVAKIAVRVFLGLMYVSAGDSFALELIGDGKKAEGEVVEDGKADDDSRGWSKHNGGTNGENGDALGGEWQSGDDEDDNESGEDDASDQQGSDDSGEGRDENSCEKDEDEECSDEEECYSGSGSDEDEEPLLDHAMEVYASDSFSLFRHEYEKGKAFAVNCVNESKPDWEYAVNRDEEKNSSPKCYKVSASFFSETVECCCNHFAVTGMLCSHALAVLKFLHIDHIPDRYLLNWRLKSMNQSLLAFQKRVKIFPSHDDCLNRFWKKKTSEDFEEHTGHQGKLFKIPFIGDDINCDDTNHFGSPILIYAKHIYLPKAYELFREEHRKSEYFIALTKREFVDWRGLVYDFEVLKRGRIDLHKVHAEAKDGTIKCSCRKFETSGILCAHTLAVFSSISIVKIPHQYLVPRLLKDPNMAADENIHGPEYKHMLEFTAYMIIRSGSTILPHRSCGSDDEESLVAVNDELIEVAKDDANKKRKAGGKEEEMAGKWKLYDDQLIKDFTYKNSQAKKRKLMDYTSSFPTNFF